MAVSEQGNGLKRVVEVGPVYVWQLYMDGRVVLDVAVSDEDEHRHIRVGRPDVVAAPMLDPGSEQKFDVAGLRLAQFAKMLDTGWHAVMVLDSRKTGPEPADVEVFERVSTTSVQFVIYANAMRLLADVFVPRSA